MVARMKKRRVEWCWECMRYKRTCKGFKYYVPNEASIIKQCSNRVKSPENVKSPLQIVAFHSLYRTKLGAGTDKDMAFIEAVVQTGDLVFAETVCSAGDN